MDNDNINCLGQIRSANEDTLLLQNIIHENQSQVFENEYNMETDDIYKELRVRGYDYGNEFRRLRSIRTQDYNHLFGTIEWNGNLVTFLDALLQSMILITPFRKLMVPVLIKSLRCDPIVLFGAIKQNLLVENITTKTLNQFNNIEKFESYNELDVIDEINKNNRSVDKRFCICKALLPFRFNANSKLLVTHGVEIESVTAFPIPRKTDIQDLKLDSYEFVANDDLLAIEDCDRKLVLEYLEVCKSIAFKVYQMCFKELKFDYDYQNFSEDLIQKLINANNENHIMFRIFDKIFKTISNENQKLNTENRQKLLDTIRNDLKFDLSKDVVNQISKNERLIRTLVDIVAENLLPKRVINVLEINLNNEILAKEVDYWLTNFQIIPTEVEYKLVVKSKSVLKDYNLAKADEWNPIEAESPPNITPNYLVIMRDSQSLWHLNVNQFVQTLSAGIVEKGFLLTVFRYRFTEPELALSSILNGNCDLNDSNLEKRINNFVTIAKISGFSLISSKSDSISTIALLFRKVNENTKIPKKSDVIEINTKYDDWFDLLKQKLINERESDNKSNVWLVGVNSKINGILGLLNCIRLEPGGETFQCLIDLDNSIQTPIDWNSKPFSDILNNDLVVNVIKNGKLGTYRHIKLPKDSDKTVSNEYYLNVGQTKDISSIQWYDMRCIAPNNARYDIKNKKIEQVQCKIYYAGLNFHDVMIATGRIPSGLKTLFTDSLLGLEFAGRRVDTGERVMGFEMSRCFATSINANVNTISVIPEHWSMEDTQTILTTYSTAWYALIVKADLKKEESILIHSGAGGVGQAAIVICQYYNCEIYVTVGTEEKKRFLMKEYGIIENRIFNSRDIQFKYRIKELTEGKGVDLVLNSLAGEKLDASYECVANCGRFLELGKFDLAQNKQLGMIDFLRDVTFFGVAVDVCLLESQQFAIDFFNWVHNNSNNGLIKPITRTVFNAIDADKAIRYMTTGKHIGKIIVKIRDEEKNIKVLKTIKPAIDMLSTTKTFFNPNKTYIITGGLGGFGVELVHWMVYMGAKKFVLTSRSGIKKDYHKYVINRLFIFGKSLKSFGVQLKVLTEDCNTIVGAKSLITQSEELGPIGGVFHLALVLNDCLLENLTFDKFCESIDCKHKMFANLDQLTRDLSYSLDYFVVFSSIICGKGNTGQTNYGFGNSICERICEQRRSDGLHGLAIQFGAIGDVGVYAESGQSLYMSTLQKQRINSCCDVLDKLLAIKQPIVTSFVSVRSEKKTEIKQNQMIYELCRSLGIDSENTPNDLTLGEIGLESMFAVELQQKFERDWNIKISINNIKNITVGMIKDYEAVQGENVKSFYSEIKRAKANILNYKFIIPNDVYTLLNNVKSGKPIYFMPPLETTFSAYEELAKKINRPVIGLNWTRELDKLSTFKEISEYYTDLLKKLSPNAKFDMLGYFDGAIITAKLIRKGLVDKAIIVDILSDIRFSNKTLKEEFVLEFIFKFLLDAMPELIRNKFFRDIKTEPDKNSKVKRFCNEIRDFAGKSLIATDLEEIFHNIIKRMHILFDYRLDQKNKFAKLKNSIGKKWAKRTGKLVVIKPFKFDQVGDIEDFVSKSREVYFLPDENESKEYISIETLDESPFAATSEAINEKIIKYLK